MSSFFHLGFASHMPLHSKPIKSSYRLFSLSPKSEKVNIIGEQDQLRSRWPNLNQRGISALHCSDTWTVLIDRKSQNHQNFLFVQSFLYFLMIRIGTSKICILNTVKWKLNGEVFLFITTSENKPQRINCCISQRPSLYRSKWPWMHLGLQKKRRFIIFRCENSFLIKFCNKAKVLSLISLWSWLNTTAETYILRGSIPE